MKESLKIWDYCEMGLKLLLLQKLFVVVAKTLDFHLWVYEFFLYERMMMMPKLLLLFDVVATI